MVEKALIVEDDPEIVDILKLHMEDLGYEVDICQDGKTGLEHGLKNNYAFVLLDLMLPRLGGMEICKRLRKEKPQLPIIMLTAKSAEPEKVLGLELGADDYITKPFSPLELKARINAILRRTQASEKERCLQPMRVGDLEIDFEKRRVTRAGEIVQLTAREFDLLAHMAAHPGRPFSRTELNEAVYGCEMVGYDQNVSAHINRIRSKIEPEPADPRYVLTVRGVGYCFCETPDTEAE